MIPRIKAPYFPMCVSSILFLFPSIAHSQQNPLSDNSDLTKKTVKFSLKAQRFVDVIATLSTKVGLNILVDDEPLLHDVTLEIDGSVKDALDQVSDAFDYTWKQKPSGIIVMYKRFHNASEHPQYSLPELRRMAHEVVNIFKAVPNAIPVDSNDDFTTRTNTFFGMLTPPQVEMLRAGRMLRGSDLNAEQAEALQTAILRNMFVDQVTPWQELMIELDGLDRSSFYVRTSHPFASKGMSAEAVLKTPTTLQLIFAMKREDGTKFAQGLAGMQSAPSAVEVK
ncbi:MAG: hypothetical protein JWL77_2674 [Chthonomonadaceae bacterium]|nr:hypothetical protein [Chthonomonadaceae bacterium]